MKITFYHRNDPFEPPFISDFIAGARVVGDTTITADLDRFTAVPDDSDIAVFVGVRGKTREVVDAYRALGRRTIILDKGAIRFRNRSTHRRVYLDGGTALAYLNRFRRRDPSRWQAFGCELAPMREEVPRAHIVYANNSQKVHDYWRLGSAEELAEQTVKQLQKMAPTRKIVFRPKPRALDFREIEGAELSLKPHTIEDALVGAHCLVTHTSHCTVNALMMGIPVVALMPNPAKNVAGKFIEQALAPPIPSEEDRYSFFCNMAWAQWSPDEFKDGTMWKFMRREMELTLPQEDEPTGVRRKEDVNDDGLRNDPSPGRVKGTSK